MALELNKARKFWDVAWFISRAAREGFPQEVVSRPKDGKMSHTDNLSSTCS